MKPTLRRCIFNLAIFLFFALSFSAEARNTGVSGTDLQWFHPSWEASGFFGVHTPHQPRSRQFTLRLVENFSGTGLFNLNVSGASVDLVDSIITTNVLAALAVSDFLTVGVDLPFHIYAKEADFTTLAPFSTWSIGDVRTAWKFRLLEEKSGRPGVSLMATQSFPTGDESKFLGTSHIVPGVTAIIGKTFRYATAALNFGAEFPAQKSILGVNFDDRILYGAGVKAPLVFWDPKLAVLGEVRGSFQFSHPERNTSPVEFTVGVQKEFKNGLALSVGAGSGWNNAIGNPRYRGVFSVGYSPAKIKLGRTNDLAGQERREGLLTVAYFRSGRKFPSTESRGWIRQFAEQIRSHEGSTTGKIRVEGYMDQSEGRRNGNLRRLRAETVKKILIREGIDPKRILISNHSADRRIPSGRTSSDRLVNQKVEISVTEP